MKRKEFSEKDAAVGFAEQQMNVFRA